MKNIILTGCTSELVLNSLKHFGNHQVELVIRNEQKKDLFLKSYPQLKEHNLKAKDLIEMLGVSKGLVSDILNYKKGMSKEIIRKLSEHFKLSQEAFNRPYPLIHT